MKFFIDSADVEEIRKAHAMGCVDGVTTNPSLLAKVGRGLEETIREICSIVDGPISAEAVSLDAEGLIAEGRVLAKIHDNVVVKIPMGVEGVKAVKALTAEGIRTNVTLIFSANQALLCAKAGATYVSPFVGRLDDISQDGMELISNILEIYSNYDFDTQVLVASVRNPVHVLQSARMGAHVATLPYSVITQLANHPLTEAGIKKFLADWEKVPKAK
ncbi:MULTISPECIES: fructose-6-phosphate aldolase [Myxococcus]|uniref:Probable transaldolase n=2 Tax=Myxococcus TaxID=32 RepID=L7UIH4_MYXSD|nr:MULTISPECIES: fructose-6-phosphate aldolase [Myxococcus]AGC47813.1 putative translaldolase [Myxococcus stipitatus DSM 14675]QSQ13363.1 fructose-6-phosphate aldolase [Myxococcus landrumus]